MSSSSLARERWEKVSETMSREEWKGHPEAGVDVDMSPPADSALCTYGEEGIQETGG